jgi:hypothetical protein
MTPQDTSPVTNPVPHGAKRPNMNQAINHWLNHFCAWLDQTPVSQIIQTKAWIVPAVQTVHILAIAVVATSALMVDLRVIGVFGRDQSPARPRPALSAVCMVFLACPPSDRRNHDYGQTGACA